MGVLAREGKDLASDTVIGQAEALATEVDRLEAALDELDMGLSPVLLQAEPKDAGGPSSVEAVASSAVSSLRNTRFLMCRVIARIKDLQNRLQVQ